LATTLRRDELKTGLPALFAGFSLIPPGWSGRTWFAGELIWVEGRRLARLTLILLIPCHSGKSTTLKAFQAFELGDRRRCLPEQDEKFSGTNHR
jgi:hypothetical protein